MNHAPALVLMALTSAACAAPVPINNHGFEADFAQDGSFPVGPVTDWPAYDPLNLLPAGGNFTGVINPTGSACFNFDDAPEGRNAAILYLAGTIGQGPIGLSQTLAHTLQAGTTYTLTVEVGNIASCAGLPPFDQFYELGGFPGYSVQLLANGVVLAEDFNTLLIPEGEFATSTAVVTAEQVNTTYAGLVGIPLEIRLINLNLEDTPADPGIEVDFDDVRLDATPAACAFADCDASGSLTIDDIDCFATGFLASDLAAADCDDNGVLNVDDIDCFAVSFLAGCP